MENNKPKNQPAFPLASSGLQSTQSGMTLRDYFAAKAMQAYISNDTFLKGLSTLVNKDSDIEETIAEKAFQMADAMLIERSKS